MRTKVIHPITQWIICWAYLCDAICGLVSLGLWMPEIRCKLLFGGHGWLERIQKWEGAHWGNPQPQLEHGRGW